MQAVIYGPNGLPLNPQTGAIVDPTWGAIRTSIRPIETNFPGYTGGHYRAVALTGTISLTASVVIAAARFAPTGAPRAYLTRLAVQINAATSGGFTRVDPISAFVARNYTVLDSCAGTAVTLSGNNSRMNTKMFSTPQMAISYAASSGGLSNGTKSLDATAFAMLGLAALNWSCQGLTGGGGGLPKTDVFKAEPGVNSPLILEANEGIVVQWGAQAQAGAVNIGLEFEWAESLQ